MCTVYCYNKIQISYMKTEECNYSCEIGVQHLSLFLLCDSHCVDISFLQLKQTGSLACHCTLQRRQAQAQRLELPSEIYFLHTG